MSAAEESTVLQGTNENTGEEQNAQETEPQEEIANDPQQPADQNGDNVGVVGEDSEQAAEPEKGDEGEKVNEGDQEQKDEVVDAKNDAENPSVVDQNNETPAEEQERTPAGEGEDSKEEEPAMSVVISEPDKDVKTQEANAQTEGRESPVGKDAEVSAGSPAKDDNRVIESQSELESESPLVAPPTSKAERSIDNETPGKNIRDQTESAGRVKDGLTANGK